MHLGHRCDDDDGHDSTHDDKEQSDLVQEWQYPVTENDKRAARPGDEHEGNIDVPWLDDQIGMENGVHLHGHVGRNGDDRGEIEYPSEEIERAGEESEHAAVAGARRYRGPVVYAAGGGDGRRELLICRQTIGYERKQGGYTYLGNRCGDESVVETCNQKLVDHTSRSSIIYRALNTCTLIDIQGDRLIETAMEPPKTTHALSMVRANPQILRSP